MTNGTGLVSVVVPVYNRAWAVPKCFHQILAQTHRPIELIFVNDGSTDNTGEVCEEIARNNSGFIRVVHRHNGGPGLARESGRQAAAGEFIQYLDSDDLIHEDKLSTMVGLLAESPDAIAAYCRTNEIDSNGGILNDCMARTGQSFPALLPIILSGRIWETSTPVLRKQMADQAGPWSNLRIWEDWEYDIRLGLLGHPIVFATQTLTTMVSHGRARASQQWEGKRREFFTENAKAHLAIHNLVMQSSVGTQDENRFHFSRRLFLLARQCAAVGLKNEALCLARASSQAAGRRGTDHKLFEFSVGMLGIRTTGLLLAFANGLRCGRSGSRVS